MPRTTVGNFLGSPEQFNLFLAQALNNTAIGSAVRRMEWKPEMVSVPTLTNHHTLGSTVLKGNARNISEPNKRKLTGGRLGNLELEEYLTEFSIVRRYADTIKQMASQSNSAPGADELIQTLYMDEAVSAYAITGEAMVNDVVSDNNNFDVNNVDALDTPIDTATNSRELVSAISAMLKRQGLAVRKYSMNKDGKLAEGNGGSQPMKGARIIVPASVAAGIGSLSDVFNATIPYNGLGNTGEPRIPTPDFLSKIFGGAEVIVPDAIKSNISGMVYYEDSEPSFIFEGNYIAILYNDPNPMRPASLVYHNTPLETEDDSDIFEKMIRMFQRAGLEQRQKNTMFKLNDILSPDFYARFALGL